MKKESLLKKFGLFCMIFIMCCFIFACNPFKGSHSRDSCRISVIEKYGNATSLSKWIFLSFDKDGYVHIVETRNQFNSGISKDTKLRIRVQD